MSNQSQGGLNPNQRPPSSGAPGTVVRTTDTGQAGALSTRSIDDPRARAAARAAELEAHWGTDDYEGEDKFYIDARAIPDGWSYEWKAHAVLGAENPSYQVNLARAGWEAVPASRHPSMMPEDWKGMTIDREGMRLMERPLTITEKAKARELRKAREQVGSKEAQIRGMPAGPNSPFATDNKGTALNHIKRDYEAIPIPK